MECYAETTNQIRPAGGNSGLRPFCVATLVGFSYWSNKMKQIDISTPMHPNTFTLVDDEDFEWLNQWNWSALGLGYGGFVARRARCGVSFLMHRQIMGEPKGLDVDHRNHNTLDNQRSNLRSCSRSQNQHNQKVRSGGSSKYKGVDLHKQTGKWRSRIRLNGVRRYIGLFINEVDAAKAYDKKAMELFSEFAYLNFPESRG